MSNEPDKAPDDEPEHPDPLAADPSGAAAQEPAADQPGERLPTGRTGGLGDLPGLTGPLEEPDLPPESFRLDPIDELMSTPLAMPSDSASDALLNQPAGSVDRTRGDGNPPAQGGPLDEAMDAALDAAVHQPLKPSDEPVDEPVDEPIDEPIDEPADEPLVEPAHPGAAKAFVPDSDQDSAQDSEADTGALDETDEADEADDIVLDPDLLKDTGKRGWWQKKSRKPLPGGLPQESTRHNARVARKGRAKGTAEGSGKVTDKAPVRPGTGLRSILHINVFNITDRYVLAELLKPFFAGVIAFMIIMVSNTLYIFMEQIVKSNVPVPVVLRMLLYSLPAIVVVTLPVAYMFATLLALGRLGRDSEIIALRACGVSLARIIMPVIVMSLIISATGFGIQEKVVPWANQQTVEILKDMMRREPVQNLKEKTFIKFDERYFYVNEIDRNINLLKQLYLLDKSKTELPQVIAAQRATREQTRWVLRRGILHKLEGTGWIDHEIRFQRMEIEMDIKPDMVFSDQPDVRSLASGEAAKLIEQKKAQGQDVRQDLMDLHTKFSLPLATFFTILLAAPIGIMFSKMGNYFGVAISIALVFIWYVTYSIFTSLGKAGTVTPVLAAWIQNIAFGGIGLMLLLQLSGVRWMQALLWPFRLLASPFVRLWRRRKPRKPRPGRA